MADACQPTQRTIYKEKYYRDGQGTDYPQQLKKLSWSVASDMPVHARESSKPLVESGVYSTLHPMQMMQTKELDEPNFHQAYGSFGIRTESDTAAPVHERLFSPSKSVQPHAREKLPESQAEATADSFFTHGRFEEAIKQCAPLTQH